MVVADVGRRRGALPAVAWPWVLAAAGVLLAVLVALSGRYGPHRDELYFVAAGRRLAWGYPDQPPVIPVVAHLADLVAPGSLVALHLPSALAAAGVVVLAALTARELGGGTGAQLLTVVATGTGVVVVTLGHILSTTTIDTLFWVAIVYAVLRTLTRDAPRGWLVVGLLAGLALLDKNLVAFLLVAIVVGIALTGEVRHHLRSPWAWAAAGIALLIWLPNLVWQATHGWPQLTLASDIRDEYSGIGPRLEFVGLLLVQFSPVAAALWIYGLVRLLRVPSLVRARPLGWAFLVLVIVFLLTGGKAYYVVGAVPVLLAAGACGLESRRSTRGMVNAGVILGLGALVAWPTALPLLPEESFGQSVYADLNDDQLEMIGWPSLVATVDEAVAANDAELVVTGNYGEAGALEWYGSDVPVASGHNGYAAWGPPAGVVGPVVLVGYDSAPDWAVGCRPVAVVDNGVDVDNEEQGGLVQVCDGPRGSWAAVWAEVTHLDA
ncbi:glycosyltransferase family 39 protein [Cellulomonas sp. P5_E12]